jgi:hypothetical protein
MARPHRYQVGERVRVVQHVSASFRRWLPVGHPGTVRRVRGTSSHPLLEVEFDGHPVPSAIGDILTPMYDTEIEPIPEGEEEQG